MINYKLIKTSEGYIIISDEEIREGDYFYYDHDKEVNKCDSESLYFNPYLITNYTNVKKIIASTYLNGLPNIDFNGFEQRVNFDNIELLAKEYIEKESKEIAIPASFFYNGLYYYEQCFIAGFNKCLEINKDKLYSAEQMKEFAIEVSSFDTHANPIISIDEHFKNFIKYLQPNTEWNIEIEHYACAEDYGVCIEGCIGKCNPKIIDNKIKITKIL